MYVELFIGERRMYARYVDLADIPGVVRELRRDFPDYTRIECVLRRGRYGA